MTLISGPVLTLRQFEYENRNRQSQPAQRHTAAQAAPILPTHQDRSQPLPSSPPLAQQPLLPHAPQLQRDSTPDPFEVDHTPSEQDDDHPTGYLLQHDPYSPNSSQAGVHALGVQSQSRLPLSQRRPSDGTIRGGVPVSVLEPPLESDEEDGENSQLFPGSDLF